MLIVFVLVSGWQYYSIGAITWPTRVATEIDLAINRGIARVTALIPGGEIEWAEDDALGSPAAGDPEPVYRIIEPDEEPLTISVGRVIKVVDGDTVHIRRDEETVKVRLLCIDAPERGQPFGNASRKHLADMVAGETVRVEGDETDRYGRLLAKLYNGDANTSANWRMVRDGYAWDFDRYTCGRDYDSAEREARDEKAGLWAEPDAVPPWEWRRR